MSKMEGSGYTVLTFERDHHEVCQSLRNLHRRNDQIVLGTALGLSYPTLLGMSNGDDFLSKMVASWLKRQDNVLNQSGEPTWSVLADKLEEIGCTEIAADIRWRNDDPPHESDQWDNNPPTLATDALDSIMDNHQSHTSVSGLPCALHCLDQTMAPISTQSVTQSRQNEPHTSASRTCLEEPPAPKRTKLDQQSIREQSSNQQLSCAASTVPATYKYAMEKMFSARVIVTPVVARSFTCRHHTASQVQLAERDALQNAVVASSLPSPPATVATTSTGTTFTTTPHQATSLSIAQSSQNLPKSTVALSSTRDPTLTESIRAEEAGETFREHRAVLLIAVTDSLILADNLYSYNVISRETLDRVKLPTLTPNEKKMELFDAVEARIQTNPSDFGTLCDILRSDPLLCIFAERLQQSYQLKSALIGALEVTNLTATMQLNRYLMEIYKSVQQSCDTKFPHLPEKAFITLAIIERGSVSRANADAFTKGTLHGHADEILKKKKPIAIETVLEPPEGLEKMKCIFVEGAPGVGKSTFALELCRIQEKLGIYSLVVLLKLREKQVQGFTNISDLFYQSANLQQAVTKEVIACKGKNVLLVLDGFDELPTELRKSSFIVELIQGKHLPECTVLVTSRPSATADLHFSCEPQIHKHIEILGFTHKHIQQYAESMLSDQPDVLKDFFKYISDNPAVYGMMYIPLNSAIVVEIYKDSRTTSKPIPHTLTQLYTQLCFVLLKKYLIEKSDPQANHLPDKFEDLSGSLKEQLIKLGKLAFEGALKQEITFDHLPEGCGHLGFMNVSTGLYLGDSKVLYYSFFHLTLQEFLAAFYISQLQSVSEQKLLFIENLLINKRRYRQCNSHLGVLWRFVAGLTGFSAIGWELVCKATTSFIGPVLIKKPIQCHSLFYQCLMEIQNEEVIRSVFRHNILSPTQIQPRNRLHVDYQSLHAEPQTNFDCYALGYCVAISGCIWNIEVSGGDEAVKMFGCGLRSVGEVRGFFHNLYLACDLTHQGMTYLGEFPCEILQNISILKLSDSQLNKFAFDILADALQHMINLTGLRISYNNCDLMSEGWMVKLFQNLVGTKIYKLDISGINLDLNDICALSPLLNTHLKELIIGELNMSSDSVELMIEKILSSSSLKHVHIVGIQFTEENASKFKLLENNKKLVSLQFKSYYGMNLYLVVQYVARALHKNKTLKMLQVPPFNGLDDETYIPGDELDAKEIEEYFHKCNDDSVNALSEMLKLNKTLQTLVICSTDLTSDNVFTLRDALQENKVPCRALVLDHELTIIHPRIIPASQPTEQYKDRYPISFK